MSSYPKCQAPSDPGSPPRGPTGHLKFKQSRQSSLPNQKGAQVLLSSPAPHPPYTKSISCPEPYLLNVPQRPSCHHHSCPDSYPLNWIPAKATLVGSLGAPKDVSTWNLKMSPYLNLQIPQAGWLKTLHPVTDSKEDTPTLREKTM